MPTQAEKLATVQESDLRILKLQKELSDIPIRQKQIEMQSDEKKNAVKAAKEDVVHRQAEAKKVELDVEGERDKIRKLREQQLQLKTNKEFKAMDEQVDLAKATVNKLEEKEIEILETVEAAAKVLAARKQDLERDEQRVREETGILDQRKAEIEKEIAGLAQEREAKAADVDPMWLRHYENIMKKKKDRTLVRVEHGVCGGCHMTLAPHLIHDARRGEMIVSCSFCGRLLY